MPRHHPMISSEYLIILRIGGSDLHDDCPHQKHQHHNQNDMRAQHFPRCSDPPPPLVAPIHSLSDARGSKESTASPFPGYTQTQAQTQTQDTCTHTRAHKQTNTHAHKPPLMMRLVEIANLLLALRRSSGKSRRGART